MKKRKSKIKYIRVVFAVLVFVNIVGSVINYSYASNYESKIENNYYSEVDDRIVIADNTTADEMWREAGKWFKGTKYSDGAGTQERVIDNESINNIVNEFVNIVNVIGTTVIVIATIALGIKYMFGSVDSKTDVKESMITLLVACVFFFGWTNISNIIIPNRQLAFSSYNDTSYKSLVRKNF